jgi:glycosyltransferase involved in cell wall biosynthesis
MPDCTLAPTQDYSLNSLVTPAATVVITTRNRLQELRKAVASALAQTAKPAVLVLDDGSTDGAVEAIAREFPGVQFERSEASQGYIVQRNRGAGLVQAPIVFSIDDDAVFSSPTAIEQTLREFDHPRVGAVAIPFVNVNSGPDVYQRAPQAHGIYATYAFIGTAHALRRDLFLALGKYRKLLVHQSEEEDYCVRMLNAGYITRCGRADPVHHFESPRRSWQRMDYYGARNKVLFAWNNVPFPFFPMHLAVTTFMTSIYAGHPARCLTRVRGVLAAYALCCRGHGDRRPVMPSVYRLSRSLKRRGAVPLEEFESRLPAPILLQR